MVEWYGRHLAGHQPQCGSGSDIDPQPHSRPNNEFAFPRRTRYVADLLTHAGVPLSDRMSRTETAISDGEVGHNVHLVPLGHVRHKQNSTLSAFLPLLHPRQAERCEPHAPTAAWKANRQVPVSGPLPEHGDGIGIAPVLQPAPDHTRKNPP